MSRDDAATPRAPRPAAAPCPIDCEVCDPHLTPEQLAELEHQELAHLRQVVTDIDAGHERLIPWDDARTLISAPFTPEELAEASASHGVRARR